MSKQEAPIGLAIMEKLVGLLLVAIGGLTFYSTYTNMASTIVPIFFLAIGLILVVLGILLFVAKTE